MKTDNRPISTIHRRLAKRGTVSFGNPIVLHETSKRIVKLVPFFIPRSSGTDLAVKIVTLRKDQLGSHLVEEKSVTLQESAARKLLRGLKEHFAVAEEDDNGSYIVIKVSQGTAQIGEYDPSVVATALTKVLSQEDVVEHLRDTELSEEFVKAFRGAIRLREMKSAVEQLRQYLDSDQKSEIAYQRWCEKHTWAFGNAYVMRDEVRHISSGDKLDILLPTVMAGYRDIVELKTPDVEVLLYDKDHRNYYFSAEVSKAIGQCHRYLDVLHEEASKGLRDHPEVIAYYPRAIIVIGRSIGWNRDQFKGLHGLNSRISGITVMTYDQLLSQGERLIEMLSSKETEQNEEELEELYFLSNEMADDEIPF